MRRLRTLGVCVLALVSAQALSGQSGLQYRHFQLGGSLLSVATLSGAVASEAKTIHLRPALMQELQWQRPYSLDTTPALADPVKQIVFSFYDDQFSRMVVDYDHDRTAGLTAADLIDAISTEYGPQRKPGVRTSRGVPSQVEEESGTPVARWGGADYSLVLYQSSYTSAFRIIVTSPRLEALARTADAQATRLDEREAPLREIARQKKDAEDARVSQEKARVTNRAAFRP